MLDQLTIQKLRELPIDGVAERLGLHVSHGRCLCPFHDDTRPSLMFRRGRNSYRCFVCNASGSGPIDLVMRMQGKSFIEACRWLADDSNIILESRKPVRKVYENKLLRHLEVDIRHLERLIQTPRLNAEARRFLYDERRISPDVVSACGLTSIDKPVPMSGDINGCWFNAPSLLIPYRDYEGKLISVQARYLGTDKSKPRFQFPKGNMCRVFNLCELRKLDEGNELFITEGVSDCLAMLSSGRHAIAIPSATLLKEADIATITKHLPSDTRLNMCPDRDAPGERLFLDLKTIFPDIIRHQLPEGYKDFGQWWASNGSVIM